MTPDPFATPGDDDLAGIIRQVQRQIDDSIGVPPGLFEAMRAGHARETGQRTHQRFGGGWQAGKTAEFFAGLDAANRRGDMTGFTLRDRHGRIITVTIDPTERVTPKVVRAKVSAELARLHRLDCERLNLTARAKAEAEIEKAGGRVVDGEVLDTVLEPA